MTYRVEPGTKGCAECGHGDTWDVVGPAGPDEAALGQSYGDRDEAEWIASELSIAFAYGQTAACDALSRRKGERRVTVAYPTIDLRKLIGRRKDDDEIPF